MDPIINPWIVYGINVIHNLCIVFVLAMVISIVGIVGVLGNSSVRLDEQETRILKVLSVIFLVSVVFLIILPSKNTMLTMLALQYVTPDNIQVVQGSIVDFVKQVAQAVESVK